MQWRGCQVKEYLPTLIDENYIPLNLGMFSAPKSVPPTFVIWVICGLVAKISSWIEFDRLFEEQKSLHVPTFIPASGC